MNDEIALDALDEIAARLTMLEFALEILFARDMASLPEELSEQAKQTFIELMAHPYGALTGDPNEARRMQATIARSAELAERFVRKVTQREAFLRAQ